ncbi:MAG: prepilin-type N-terminal cleavage/methylation domain-containing protein [Candidatus Pacebacteria bacterium]|nr:prepilin-type N-terminal cleavage/methylation domain-containing protein [Candidatus Paceibacterota bacterium]
MFKNKIVKKNNEGFSIPELLVVIGIMAIFVTFVFIRENDFKSTLQLRNVAHELALSIRETQAYGIGILRDSPTGSEGRYGMHIDLSHPTYTILYTDDNKDGQYSSDELLKKIYFEDQFSIQKLCIYPTTIPGVEKCSDSDPSVQSLDILFVRPDPDALMTSFGFGEVSLAKIFVGISGATPVNVQVSRTGQVSIK